MASSFDDIRVSGTITVPDTGISVQRRSTILRQDDNAVFPINLTELRVWDAFHTDLPGTAAADDLALVGGTFGTAPPMIQAGDLKAAGATTRYARFTVALPECYVTGETITFILSAGIKTTVADTSCTVDMEVYLLDKLGAVGSDLCSTSAQSINSLTFTNKTFTVSSAGAAAGSVYDVRIAITCTDAATATAVIPSIAAIDLVCDIKG